MGIGLDDKKYGEVQDGFHLDVFMGSEWYQKLQEEGIIGLRSRLRNGSKINIYNRSKLDCMEATRATDLEFYRDYKERLPDYFG